ncbi:MAG TPA: hypothetical protein VL122_12335 [Nitrospirota bacterium]|nr:hypothetical protein [Nitrospirota bacterium]
MARFVKKALKSAGRETLTEAYEVRAFRDESEEIREAEPVTSEIVHAEQGAIQAIKNMIKGHGEQTILPDDCQFGDNDLCSVES